MNWKALGNCVGEDPEMFFPEKRTQSVSAKRICLAGCPVRAQCLDFALRNEELGVWGATDEWDRRAILGRFTARRATGMSSSATLKALASPESVVV